MAKMIDRAGRRYGRLLVLEQADDRFTSSGRRRIFWRCQCDCGTVLDVDSGNLTGNTKSCGCLHREVTADYHRTHGLCARSEYRIWTGMKQRCLNSENPNYKNYGGRGIQIDPRWMDFEAFYQDMGSRPGPEFTLDRIDNYKGYGPENCRWATKKEQARNRRGLAMVVYQGRRMSLSEVAEMAGIPYHIIFYRWSKNWPVEQLTAPPTRRPRRSRPQANG